MEHRTLLSGLISARGVLRVAGVALLLVTPALCSGEDRCPWMTEGSASGLLETEAVVAFTPAAGNQPAVCRFTSDGSGAKRILRISVEIASDAHARFMAVSQVCGRDGMELKAIGNEARACAVEDADGGKGERAVGRVRDQVFVVDIESNIKNDPVLTRDALRSKINAAAEQVAGNLY